MRRRSDSQTGSGAAVGDGGGRRGELDCGGEAESERSRSEIGAESERTRMPACWRIARDGQPAAPTPQPPLSPLLGPAPLPPFPLLSPPPPPRPLLRNPTFPPPSLTVPPGPHSISNSHTHKHGPSSSRPVTPGGRALARNRLGRTRLGRTRRDGGAGATHPRPYGRNSAAGGRNSRNSRNRGAGVASACWRTTTADVDKDNDGAVSTAALTISPPPARSTRGDARHHPHRHRHRHRHHRHRHTCVDE